MKIIKGEIILKNEKLQIYQGYMYVLEKRIKIICGICQSGRNVFDSIPLKNDKEMGRFFRLFIYFFALTLIKNEKEK